MMALTPSGNDGVNTSFRKVSTSTGGLNTTDLKLNVLLIALLLYCEFVSKVELFIMLTYAISADCKSLSVDALEVDFLRPIYSSA
jgi:hypothetical protein